MKNIMKLFLVLIVLGSIGFASEDNLTKSISVKNNLTIESLHYKYNSLILSNEVLLARSKENIESASFTITWSSYILVVVGILVAIMAFFGSWGVFQSRTSKKEMEKELQDVKKMREKLQNQINEMKEKADKESKTIFKTIYLLNDADNKYYSGQMEQARENLEEILKINPDDYNATCWLARTYIGQEQYDIAIDVAEEAVKLSTSPLRAYDLIVSAHKGNLNYSEAISIYEEHLATEEDTSIINSYAYCLLYNRNYELAESAFRRSNRFNRTATAFLGVGKALLMQNNYEEAIKYCRHALTLADEEEKDKSSSVWTLYNRASAHMILNETDNCIEYIEMAIKKTRNKGQLRTQLIDCELVSESRNIDKEESEKCIAAWAKHLEN